ncbi:MAG: hypothetical protein NTY95_09335, partial [Bacteroidia bacterium]|nr:hypothetical protein [Bacteroidia bacterium]
MKKNLILFTIILLVALFSCSTNSKEKSVSKGFYYVDNETGNDKYQGTLKKTLKTISEANKRIQNKPGSIFFAGGQVFEGTLNLNNIIGVDSIPIIVGSYGVG